MNFKSKALGFAATTTLSLTMFTGAMAADGDVTATLNDGEEGCHVEAFAGSINLGTFTWDGSSMTYTGGDDAASSVQAEITSGLYAGEDCSIQAAFTDLSGDNPLNTIPGEELVVSSTTPMVTGDNPFNVRSGSLLTVEAALNPSLMDAYAPDNYKGTVTLTVVEGGQ